jgi:hypothetical protein
MITTCAEKRRRILIGLQTKSGYSSPNLPFPKLNIATQEGDQWVLLHPKGLLSQPKQRKKGRKDMGQDIRVRVVHTLCAFLPVMLKHQFQIKTPFPQFSIVYLILELKCLVQIL